VYVWPYVYLGRRQQSCNARTHRSAIYWKRWHSTGVWNQKRGCFRWKRHYQVLWQGTHTYTRTHIAHTHTPALTHISTQTQCHTFVRTYVHTYVVKINDEKAGKQLLFFCQRFFPEVFSPTRGACKVEILDLFCTLRYRKGISLFFFPNFPQKQILIFFSTTLLYMPRL